MSIKFVSTIPQPCLDCEGNRINIGDLVYLPSGWTGIKPNPWRKALVIGICMPCGGNPWISLDGYDIHNVPAYITCLRDPATCGPLQYHNH
jgi:hypothetical protein